MAAKKTTKKRTNVPSLRHCNGRGFVELSGRRVYLGPWGAPGTEEAYHARLAEWFENGRRLPVPENQVTVVEIIAAYVEHAEAYYRRPDGSQTSTCGDMKAALGELRGLYGRTPVSSFGPTALRAMRQVWVDRGLARTTVNTYTSYIKRMFRWAVSREMIGPGVHVALASVENLKKGRSEARETEPKRPIPTKDIEAIRPYVSRQVWTLVQLQLLTGARASELLSLRAIDIDTSEDVWAAKLRQHKTSYLEKSRTIHFGPKAQAALKEFMGNRPLDANLFTPREAEAERYAKCKVHRRPGQLPDVRISDRVVGQHYRGDSYRRAIQRACEQAGVPVWTPHRLRHTAATRIREEFGLEAAQVTLGHAELSVTQVYAEKNENLGIEVAREFG